ncbi:MAG TPA: trypsin-like peptidase domain-containing protein [Polyangia bacterium]|nr:trypsin-like peptidase domain-containing protein [Polyangia bacterium]
MPGKSALLIASLLPMLAGATVAADGGNPLWTSAPRKRGPVPSLPDLADRARPAVVHVRGLVEDDTPDDVDRSSESGGGAGGPRTSIGTGFLISKDGYLVTNEHVVRGAADLRIRLYDGRELPACVVGADTVMDIALIKIAAAGPLPVLPLGDSDAVRVGESVVAIGNPYGFNHSVTSGIVSAKERVVERSSHEAPQQDIYSFFIQTDASINLGNSGGPLIDASGAVIGVSAAFWAGHPLQPAQGIGFAIPINMAKAILPRLRDKGAAPRSYLGVDAQPIDSALEAALRLPSTRGALIASVGTGSPADVAGLEPGDVVVTWNGADVATSEDLKIDAQLSLPGGRVRIGILRDGKRVEKEVVPRLAAMRAPPPHPSGCNRPRAAATPAENDFDVADAAAGQAAGLPGGRGVTVSHLAEHGAAAQAGVRVGDFLLRIGKNRIHSAKDVESALRAFSPGDTYPALLRRAGFDFWTAISRR